MIITGDFERFQLFNFESSFLKNEERYLKKLECRFSVESTTIENATFSYRYALSKTIVKTSRMSVQNGYRLNFI